ncbi:UDP-N-acetyl glucosamine 2-epimerase [Halorhabdus amylolytica]|uniref:UDP-N-acetyl glucosamine 2-epimerase n=1 Tax=Halorhabdus amylolytica TaxID=2559573 RepID=UPI0010A9BCE0|nr:UDP-N-acetylglucosamine 2-epimerase [Halorhabdus amylolytica]
MSSELMIYEDRLARQMDAGEFVLAVVTATKPDFYKQAPVVTAAREHDVPCFVLHTGQHYDDVLGHGLEEYGIEDRVAVDLGIRGSLSEKTAQVHSRIDELADHLAENWPDTTVLPIVHGDTHAAGVVPQAWLFATNQAAAHNEAGLRGMSPDFEDYDDPAAFVERQWNGEWSINRAEPFPEQYDTFVGSAASIYHFAPVELNREHLENEGYPAQVDGQQRIPVVGNSVVDAIEMKRNADLEESIFDIYPVLEERDEWLRVDIHRRANLLPDRFEAIVEGVIGLVEDGYNVNFVELTATEQALKQYGYREKLLELDENRDNFLFTGLWKKHAHVYEFLTSGQCFAEFTDSGSMQEELNYIDEAACLTARFNTDRPETVFDAGTNLLVPPVNGEYVQEMVEYVAETDAVREEIATGPNLYGGDVGGTIVEFLEEKREEVPFDWAHERVGFSTSEQDFEYL